MSWMVWRDVSSGRHASDAAEPVGSIEEPAFRSFEPPKFERPSYESLSAAMAAAEQRQAVPVEPTFASHSPASDLENPTAGRSSSGLDAAR